MGQHTEKIELLRKYSSKIKTSFDFHVGTSIPSKKIDNALKSFASGLDRKTIIGFYDTTVTGTGKSGYIFTDTKVYYHESFEKPKKLWYNDIESIELYNTEKKDCDRGLRFHMADGTTILWSSSFLNKTPLMDFFLEMQQLIQASSTTNSSKIEYQENTAFGAQSAGVVYGNVSNASTMHAGEMYHTPRGHGFAAEHANHLYDKFSNADFFGQGNVQHVGQVTDPTTGKIIKDGADRIVNGVNIQTKYCSSGSKCVSECFENGKLRYINPDGSPMQIEVPSDKYADAIKAMEDRIKKGEVSGVTDPAEAKKIIKKGHFTYLQAKNIAKAGTVESIIFDSVNGAIIATSTFGISAALDFATSIWNGEPFDIALKSATYTGLKVGGTTFVTAVLAGQLTKAGLNSALVNGSEAVIKVLGPKGTALLANAFRTGNNIYGAAAMKSAAKLLRNNVITGVASIVVLSSADVVSIFRKRISGKQLFKNLTETTASVAGGTAGWIGGAAAGAAIGSVVPVVGTAIGGTIGSLVGAFAGGSISGKAAHAVMGAFIEDDADKMVSIIEKQFTALAIDYLLTQEEAEKVSDRLQGAITGKTLKDMFASDNRQEFASNLLVPHIETITAGRKFIKLPTSEELQFSLRSVLEEIADQSDIESSKEPTPSPTAMVDHVIPATSIKKSCRNFRCELHLFAKEDGGRAAPIFTNYMPAFSFEHLNITGVITLPDDVEYCNPGEGVRVTVSFKEEVQLNAGDHFSISDNGKTVGTGTVVDSAD